MILIGWVNRIKCNESDSRDELEFKPDRMPVNKIKFELCIYAKLERWFLGRVRIKALVDLVSAD